MKRSGKFQVFLISKGGVKMTEKKKEKEHEKKKTARVRKHAIQVK